MTPLSFSALQPGQLLARGVCRALLSHDFVPLTEYSPKPGLRVDVMAVGPKGEIWVVECKSSRADFKADHKWHNYLDWCDRYFWAVDVNFPTELLPAGHGLILADAHGGEITVMAPEQKLAAARRAVVLRGFGRAAARGLMHHRDRKPGRAGWQSPPLP